MSAFPEAPGHSRTDADLDSADLESASWDALRKAERGEALIGDLQARPVSPLVAARLAQLHLRAGRKDLALQALRGVPEQDELVRATRLAVLAALGDAHGVLRGAAPPAAPPLSGERGGAGAHEATARTLHARAVALWTLHRYAEAAEAAGQAALVARAGGMPRFASVCALLGEDCLALRAEEPPAERERVLRARLEGSPSLEARWEATINLMQLMYRCGRYDASFELARTLPRERLGRNMHDIALIATGQADGIDWAALQGTAQYGRLRAVLGTMRLDAAFVLAGPPPDAGAALSARHHAEWSVSYAWAWLVSGAHERALHAFESPFIHRSEWDLRLIRDLGLLELLARRPGLVERHANPVALAQEALWLARDRVSPTSVLMTRFPRATPHAAALLVAAPGGCAPLEDFVREGVALVNGHGLVLGGITRTQATAVRRLLLGEQEGEAPLASGPRRSARARLNAALAAHGHPALVCARDILDMLGRLTAVADETERGAWRAASERYARDHALTLSFGE